MNIILNSNAETIKEAIAVNATDEPSIAAPVNLIGIVFSASEIYRHEYPTVSPSI